MEFSETTEYEDTKSKILKTLQEVNGVFISKMKDKDIVMPQSYLASSSIEFID